MKKYQKNDELMHYGVLGMKWGVHRANKLAEKAANARAKGDTTSAAKYAAKSKKIKAKHTMRSGGKEEYNFCSKEYVGKSLFKLFLLSTYGDLRYNEARAKGADRGEAAVKGILYGLGNVATSGLLGIAEPRLRGK